MTGIKRDLLIATALTVAIVIMASALFAKLAHSDGLVMPPPLPGRIVTLPFPRQVVLPSCWETAIQLGYQTGNPNVAQAAIEACRIYAPWRPNEPQTWPVPLGIYPPSIPLPPLDR